MKNKLLMRKYRQKTQELVEVLKKIEPEKIILFGSAASGRINKDSDIDFCMIKRGDRLVLKRKIWDLLWKADYDWEPGVDIHIYSPEIYQDWFSRNDPFLEEIKKGRVVYEKG